MSEPSLASTAPPPSVPEAMDLFAWCPRCGAVRTGEVANPFQCGVCRFSYFFNTASAVAVFIQDDAGRCLFIRRAREPSKGKLALAGGFTDPGETGEEAIRREIREELGVELGPLSYVGSWPNRYHAGGFAVPVLDLFFRALLTSHTMSLDAGEVSGIEWLRPEEVDPNELAFASMKAAVQAFAESRASP